MKSAAKTGAGGEIGPSGGRAVSAPRNVPMEFGEECGGKSGVPYRSFAKPPAKLVRLTVWHREFVDGLLLETDEGALPRIGGTGIHHDVQEQSFSLAKEEVITGISVEYGEYVHRLVFHSNRRDYGPFGREGAPFKKRVDAPPGRVVAGFKGRHWLYIDSIQLIIL